MGFIIRILVTGAVAFGLSYILKGIHIDTYWTAILFALVLAVINIIIRPIFILLTIPITVVTFGLFLFVINALLVLLAAKFISGIQIDGFWWGLLFSFLLSLVSSILFSKPEE
ncbi:MAG: phage holin family protein [Chitinophagaceae bacterium]|nr:phage holin family protein [Chitinophagaceae bacterium]MCW5929718.1 phage holin family protein [Chitinophagaceae bacterium]